MHLYVSEKLRTEKMQILIGKAFEIFLQNLEKPMELNKGMRLMKEPNYSKFRGVIRDPAMYGDRILASIAENCEKVGISYNSYHLVHEGFWDLYCRKPMSADLTAKKLEPWFNLINLRTPAFGPSEEENKATEPVAEGEGEEKKAVEDYGLPASVPVKAVVRVRIPFKKPEPELVEDENGNTVEVIPEVKEDDPKEEIEPDDKILMLPTMNDSYRIHVIHQHASRLTREHIAKAFKEFMPELSVLDEEEMLKTIEKDAEQIESEFFALKPDLPVFDFEIN